MRTTRSKAEILASALPAVEKVWQIASQRSDIGKAVYGVEATRPECVYERIGDCCCPIGAVVHGEVRDVGIHSTAAALLGTSVPWVNAFVHGFDGTDVERELDADEGAGYAAGQEIRRRFLKKGVELE